MNKKNKIKAKLLKIIDAYNNRILYKNKFMMIEG